MAKTSIGTMEDKLNSWPDDPPASSRQLRLLAMAASDFFDRSIEELRERKRTPDRVWMRAVCMWIARDAGYTFNSIGEWWKRDHGTVINAVDLVNDLREQKPAYDKQFRQFALFAKKYIRRHKHAPSPSTRTCKKK